jgi:hypothetical protein
VAAGGTASVRPAGTPDQPPWAGTVDGMAATGRCDSCGDLGVEVEPVRRAYVTPEAWDTEEKVEVLEDVEHWCFPCRTSYPHAEVEPG